MVPAVLRPGAATLVGWWGLQPGGRGKAGGTYQVTNHADVVMLNE